MSTPLIIRADASAQIGTGHVMRCLALAQVWQLSDGHVVFAHAELTPALALRVATERVEAVPLAVERGSTADAQQTITLARARGAAWIVADGYCFDAAWQRAIRDAGFRLLVIDDYGHARHYHADIVLNQNASAVPTLYTQREPYTRLLLGTRFALLRQEFLRQAREERATPVIARKLLVTLGGSDPDNVTEKVIQSLADLDHIETVVVVGGSNPHRAALEAAVHGNARLRLVVEATNIPELMTWADAAVSASGSTSWELACLGVPTAQIVLADNQIAIAATLAQLGVTLNLGDHRNLSVEGLTSSLDAFLGTPERRRIMSERGRQLVDTHGSRRVAAALGLALRLTIVSDANSWVNPSIAEMKASFEADGHRVHWIHDPAGIESGDIAFFLSLSRLVPAVTLSRHAHNLVVHGSALPHGRGWSPLTWQILEGKNEIPLTLFEAAADVDSGDIYAQDVNHFDGHELIDEMRTAQAVSTIKLCRDFVARYPFVMADARKQLGTPTYYLRRLPHDSRLDPDKTLREQFNLLRVSDPDRYPAFFELAGHRYEIRLAKKPADRRHA